MEEKNVSVKRRAYMGLMKCLMWLSAGLTCLLVLFLIGYVLYKGLPNITWELLSTSPSYLADSIGILPDLMNTLYIVIATLRNTFNNIWSGRNAVLLPVLQDGYLPYGRRSYLGDNEPAHRDAHHSGEP